MFKNKEYWEYYTFVSYDDIYSFAGVNNLDPVEAIEDFRINYCSNSYPIESVPGIIDDEFNTNVIDTEEISVEYEPVNVTKELELDAGDDIVDESKTYEEFIKKTFDKFEKNTLHALSLLNKKAIHPKSSLRVSKNLGDFLKSLFNSVYSFSFFKHVKRFMKQDLVAGLESVEDELNVDIGFTEKYQQKLDQLSSQQIEGYTINGKKWHGIKGVIKEIQQKVIESVTQGTNEGKTIDMIKDDIKKIYSGFTDHRSELIARTESNRVVNEGILMGYKESKLDGGKILKVSMDDRTSPICKRLHAIYSNMPIGLDDFFIDPETNKAFLIPPFHIQCRSRVAFRPK